MREIKFRQRIKGCKVKDCVVKDYWHYWGYFIDEREFIGPIGIVEWDKRESQQYTDLKDNQNKPIYEGDVAKVNLADGRNVLAVIEFIDGCFELNFTAIVGRYGQDRDYLKCFTINHAVLIIGNIYENPGLLEGKK